MRTVVGVALVVALLAACGSEPVGSADCSATVRLDGRVYVGYWFTDAPGGPLGEAEVAACDDVGADAKGSVFTDDAEPVPARAVPGFEPEQVILVDLDAYDRWHVMIADDAPDALYDRLDEAFGE